MFNALTTGTFCQKIIFGHFGDFQAGDWPNQLQSSPKGICNMTACLSCHQHCVLRHFASGMNRNRYEFLTRNWCTSLGFLNFLNFFCLSSFFSLSFLFAVVIDILLGFTHQLAAKKEESIIEMAIFYMEQPCVVAGNFALNFSLNFLSIFVHISGFIRPITLVLASLQRSNNSSRKS